MQRISIALNAQNRANNIVLSVRLKSSHKTDRQTTQSVVNNN